MSAPLNKVYKRGDTIYKEGDKILNVVFIQTGSVSQCLIRDKKNIELFKLGMNQVLGESVIAGINSHATSAIATTETKTLEIPVDVFKKQYETAPQFLKMLLKSLADRLKMAINEFRSVKMERDSSPCPDESIPRVYGSIFFTALHKGEKDPKTGKTEVEWTVMKSYAQRIFGESQKRMEQAINILVKMKLAEYIMGKLPEDPDGPDVIQQVIIYDIGVCEAFFEFYQYYYYKPGKQDVVRYDEFATNLLDVMIKCADGAEVDRFGVVSIDFNKVQEKVQEDLGVKLNQDHFNRLELKGIVSKRRAIDGQGVKLEFEIREYKNMFFSWKILREIAKWNERGYVDMDEKEEQKKKNVGPACDKCGAAYKPPAKFCGECGAKLPEVAKAS